MNIDTQKKALRKEIKVQKKLLTQQEKESESKAVFQKIEALPVWEKAKTVMLYWSMTDEVSTHYWVEKWSEKKNIILPCVAGDELELRRFEGIDSMKAGESFKILEPTGSLFNTPNQIDMIVVPGVAFGKNKTRMGRGKAFYDKLLSTTDAVKIGVCFSLQLFDKVPTDRFDIAMDGVITPKETIL